MAGRKRAAPVDTTAEKRETRSTKVAKTGGTRSAGRAAKGAARHKTSMSYSAFKSRAMPLYVDITTTAPTENQESAMADPGFLANTTLVPSTFATGSFGWKGHKRLVVELPKAEGEEDEEKVHVMLTINATVVGSKYVKEGEEHEGEVQEAGEHAAEEASGEAAESHPEQSPQGEEKQAEDKPPTGEKQAEESAS